VSHAWGTVARLIRAIYNYSDSALSHFGLLKIWWQKLKSYNQDRWIHTRTHARTLAKSRLLLRRTSILKKEPCLSVCFFVCHVITWERVNRLQWIQRQWIQGTPEKVCDAKNKIEIKVSLCTQVEREACINYKYQLVALVIPVRWAWSPNNPFLFLPHRLVITAKVGIPHQRSAGSYMRQYLNQILKVRSVCLHITNIQND